MKVVNRIVDFPPGFFSEASVARNGAERSGAARASGGSLGRRDGSSSPGVPPSPSFLQSFSFPLLLGGVPARVRRVRFAHRCRRFQSCRTRSSCTSSYPDSSDLRRERPLSLACLTAATGDSAPSNPRVNTRPTSCSYGREPPDRKSFPARFSGHGWRP